MTEPVQINLEIDSEQAWALAQLVKRLCWSEVRSNAVNDDEAYTMRDALGELAKALSEVGFSPR